MRLAFLDRDSRYILKWHSLLRVSDVTGFDILAALPRSPDVSFLQACFINTRLQCGVVQLWSIVKINHFGQAIAFSEGDRASRAVIAFRKPSTKQLFNQRSMHVVINRVDLGGLLVLVTRRLGHAVFGGLPDTVRAFGAAALRLSGGWLTE